MENVYKSFSHYESPVSDFERGRTQIATPFDYYDLDLSTANTNLILPIAGDFLYIDMASTGVATIELNNQQEARKAPFQVRKGFALQAVFKQLKITNTAQPGLFLRIMSSVGERVIPALGDVNISGSVNAIEDGITYGAAFSSSVPAPAANTVLTVVAPAANVNGLVVHDASYCSLTAGTTLTSLLAKASTPTALQDGDVLMLGDAYTPSSVGSGSMKQSFKVAAGKGLYLYTLVQETFGYKRVIYTLL